jgi:hypothetical protein
MAGTAALVRAHAPLLCTARHGITHTGGATASERTPVPWGALASRRVRTRCIRCRAARACVCVLSNRRAVALAPDAPEERVHLVPLPFDLRAGRCVTRRARARPRRPRLRAHLVTHALTRVVAAAKRLPAQLATSEPHGLLTLDLHRLRSTRARQRVCDVRGTICARCGAAATHFVLAPADTLHAHRARRAPRRCMPAFVTLPTRAAAPAGRLAAYAPVSGSGLDAARCGSGGRAAPHTPAGAAGLFDSCCAFLTGASWPARGGGPGSGRRPRSISRVRKKARKEAAGESVHGSGHMCVHLASGSRLSGPLPQRSRQGGQGPKWQRCGLASLRE